MNFIDQKLVALQLRNLRQIVFEVTDRCNLKCKYCGYGDFYDDYDLRTQKEMPFKTARLFIDYIINYWKNNPSVSTEQYIYIGFYGGEPLLNIRLIKSIVAYLKKIVLPYKKFQFGMTTNAILLNKHMDFLINNNFSLLISLDGNEFNHSYRVDNANRNSFEKVLNNIELLREKHPSFFSTNVNFNSVLHNRNSVAEIFHFIKNKFNKTPRITELNTSGIKPSMHQLFWKIYKNKEEDLHKEKNYNELQKELFLESGETRRLALFIHQYSGNVFENYNDLFLNKDNITHIPTGTCLPFGKKVFITVNGKILPCEKISQTYLLGKITEQEVLVDFDRIAEKYNNWYRKLENQCNKCFNKNGCTKCMFTIDNLDAPICNQFMDKKRFEQMTRHNLDYLKNHPELYKRIMEDVIITT
jgi:uncharacterized protein